MLLFYSFKTYGYYLSPEMIALGVVQKHLTVIFGVYVIINNYKSCWNLIVGGSYLYSLVIY